MYWTCLSPLINNPKKEEEEKKNVSETTWAHKKNMFNVHNSLFSV